MPQPPSTGDTQSLAERTPESGVSIERLDDEEVVGDGRRGALGEVGDGSGVSSATVLSVDTWNSMSPAREMLASSRKLPPSTQQRALTCPCKRLYHRSKVA